MKRVPARTGRWFEELETGCVYEYRPGRTGSETDNIMFTTLTMNTQSLNWTLNMRHARSSEHGW
jgi:acyl dehydratase